MTTAADDGTILGLRDAVVAGDRSALEICRATLDRIAALEPALHAFTSVLTDSALAQAAEIDANRNAWRDRPLLGVPITVKDVICTRGVDTTAGSRILAGFRPPYDATVVTRLVEAGAVIVGKTNCDEFAMGSSTEHAATGPSRNPWDTRRTPGGSSGGAAVTVAARMTSGAIGSDTGGSIRQPAAFCGIVGLKPTYGRVSRYGLLAFASSLDQIGPLTLTVADAAALLAGMAGEDPCDATSAARPVPDFSQALTGDVDGARIGVPRAILADGVDAEVLSAFERALGVLTDQGATLVDIELPHVAYGIPVYYLVAPAEASSNLARYDGVRYGFRAGVQHDTAPTRGDVRPDTRRGLRRRGQKPHHARHIRAERRILRRVLREGAAGAESPFARDYDAAFARVDVVATPTTPTPAFPIGERTDDPLAMYLGDIFTVSANLTGLPAISLPAGLTRARLPVGLQLLAPAFDENALFRLGSAYERDAPWWKEHPPTVAG